MTRPRVGIVGGGVTGLAAAYALRESADVVLLESTDRLGGSVLTFELDGVQLEAGPDSLLARDDRPVRLLRELGLEREMVEPSNFGAWIAVDGRLRRLPAGFVLGVPASPAALLRSRVLSVRGLVRAAGDLVLPGRLDADDISVGGFVRKRFGSEVAERLVDPLMAGIRAGDIDRMSLRMAAAPIYEIARKHRSVTLGLRRARGATERPRFIGLRSGMSTLVRTLTERSGAEVRLGSRVDKISRNDSRYELQSSGGNEVVDACVIAAPARSAAGMLGELAPGVAERLSQMTYASSAVINLIYPGGAVTLPPSGSGVLIPRSAGLSILACTWVSSKWPHIAPTDGRSVLRCVIGRVPGDLDATDEQLVERAVADVRSLLTSRADPETSAVHRWERALPQFEVGHLGRLADIEQTIGNLPIRLVGAGYRATGLNDCLAQGAEAARSLFAARD